MPRIRQHPNTDSTAAVLDLPFPVVEEDLQPDEPPAVETQPVETPPIRTAEPTPPPVALPTAVDVIARRTQELAVAEELFVKQEAGEPITADEEELLRFLYPDKFARAAQGQRVHRYRSLQRTAGSTAERTEVETAAQETAAELAEEGPAIRAQIEELQQQLQALEKSAAAAQADHARRSQAVDALRDPLLLGEPFRSRYHAARDRWERDYGRPSRSLRNQAVGYRKTAGLDPAEDSAAIAMYAQGTKGQEHLVKTQIELRDPAVRSSEVRDRRIVKVDAAAWQQHAQELLQQADAAEAEAERLEQDGQALKAELDGMLNALIPC